MQPPPPPPPPMNHLSNMENGGHNPGLPKSTGIVFSLNVLHNITQICLGGVIVSALLIANLISLSETLAQHIILCTTGYFILMAQAILLFSPVGWANNIKTENKKVIHFTMHFLGCILAISGGAVAMAETNVHFNSGHAICGFLALIMTVVSLVGGILQLIFPQQLSSNLMKITHSCVGSITMFMAFIALLLAFHVYYREIVNDTNANFVIVLTIYSFVGTLLMALINNVKRILGK